MDIEGGRQKHSAAVFVGKCIIWNLQDHTDRGSQRAGVLRIMGSFTPAFSLFCATSAYDCPVATTRLSSSDNAIQVSRGALRKASRRPVVARAGIFGDSPN